MQTARRSSSLVRAAGGTGLLAAAGLCAACLAALFVDQIRASTGSIAAIAWMASLVAVFVLGAALGRRGVQLPGDGLVGRALETLHHVSPWDGFEARLGEELARAARAKIPFSLILLHVDQLVAVESILGRGMARRVLHEVGRSVCRTRRPRDVIARWGGRDAYAILAPWTNGAQARALAERICAAVRGCGRNRLGAVPVVTVSIGVTDLQQAVSFDAGNVFHAAVSALREAEIRGGDCVVMSSSGDQRLRTARGSEQGLAKTAPPEAAPAVTLRGGGVEATWSHRTTGPAECDPARSHPAASLPAGAASSAPRPRSEPPG